MRFSLIALAASRAPEVAHPGSLTLADAFSHTEPLLGLHADSLASSATTTTGTTTQSIGDAIDDMLGDMCKDRPDDERCAKFTSPTPETTTTTAPETTTITTTTAAPETTTPAPVTMQEG